MRKIWLASAALLSVLLFGTIAGTTPVPQDRGWRDAKLDGYGVYSAQAAQR